MKKIKNKWIITPMIFFFLLAMTIWVSPDLSIYASASGLPHGETGEYSSEEVLVKFKPGTPAEAKRFIEARHGLEKKDSIPGIDVNLFSATGGKNAREMAEILNRNPNVVYAEPNFIATTQMAPNDPYYDPYQTGLQNTEPGGAWEVTVGCSSITIAVLDTGIDYNHADLEGRVSSGYDFINNNDDALDDGGHGTHVAGIIGAATDNDMGIAGTTWENPMMPVKVLNSSGSGTYAGVAQGIIYAADNGAEVINMSLGGSSPSDTLEEALQYAYDKGVVLVAAAGNNNGSVLYPAAYPTVIAVGAVDDNDVKANFSSYGPEIVVTAPGVQVWSTMMSSTQNAYATGSGTSFAAPFVAGLAGLILSVNPDLNPYQVQELIQQGAEDLGEPGWDPYYGWGRINLSNSLALISEEPEPIAVTGVSIVENDQELIKGESVQRTAVVEPEEAENKGVEWHSSDKLVATVDEGLVQAVSEGSAKISVVTDDGGFTDSVEITVLPIPEPEPETYDITTSVNPADAGLTYGDGSFEEGEEVTISIVPDEGYNFINWTLDGTKVTDESSYTFKVEDNEHYTANLELKEHTVTYLAGEGGFIEGETIQIVEYGQDGQEVTALPYENYEFVGWEDGITEATRVDKDITRDLEFKAYFEYMEPEPEPDEEPDYKEETYSDGVGHRNQPQELSYEFDAIGGNIEIDLTWSPWRSNLALYLYDEEGNLVAKSNTSGGRDAKENISACVKEETYKIVVRSKEGQGNFTLVIKNTN